MAHSVGGAHPGLGTANLLASVGDGVYLEFIGPNPELSEPRGFGARLVSFREPGIAGFAARTADMAATEAAAVAAGLTTVGPAAGSREALNGALLTWTALYLQGHDYGDQVPFYIDWGNTPHPSGTSGKLVISMSASRRSMSRADGIEQPSAPTSTPNAGWSGSMLCCERASITTLMPARALLIPAKLPHRIALEAAIDP